MSRAADADCPEDPTYTVIPEILVMRATRLPAMCGE